MATRRPVRRARTDTPLQAETPPQTAAAYTPLQAEPDPSTRVDTTEVEDPTDTAPGDGSNKLDDDTAGRAVHSAVDREGVTRVTKGHRRRKNSRKKSRGTPFQPTAPRAVLPRERDRHWLELVCRFRHLTRKELAAFTVLGLPADQRPAAMKSAEKAIENRLPALRAARWFDTYIPYAGSVQVLLPGNGGTRYVWEDGQSYDWLVAKSTKPSLYENYHDAAIVRIALRIMDRDPLARTQYLLTEREIRAALNDPNAVHLAAHYTRDWTTPPTLDREQWVTRKSYVKGKKRGSIDNRRLDDFLYDRDAPERIIGGFIVPDLLLLRDGKKALAIEVEATAKDPASIKAVLMNYLSQHSIDRYGGVIYYCLNREIEAVVRAGLDAAIEALRVDPDAAKKFITIQQMPDDLPLPLDRPVRVIGEVS